ncbi:MAG: hypothetical protein NUV91_04135 [Candidatus Omnitrophica bacterium]|nr:hypothetical protein [Candidatus Omnitrophota bacterium]
MKKSTIIFLGFVTMVPFPVQASLSLERESTVSIEVACIESYLLSQKEFDWQETCYKKNKIFGRLSNAQEIAVSYFEDKFKIVELIQVDELVEDYPSSILEESVPSPRAPLVIREAAVDRPIRRRISLGSPGKLGSKRDFFLFPIIMEGPIC